MSDGAVLPVMEATDALVALQRELQGTLQELRRAHAERYADRTRQTHRLLQESLETGDHSLATTALLGLIAESHVLKQEMDGATMHMVLPCLKRVHPDRGSMARAPAAGGTRL